MMPPDFDDCFAALGLEPTASAQAVRARYRRLLFLNHPDRNGDDAYARHRFVRVAQAYCILSKAFARCGRSHPLGRCQACGELADLFRAPDGNYYCECCSTDRRGRRSLPAPPVVVATCGGVTAILVAAAILLVVGMRTGLSGCVVASLVSAGAALAWLMVVCLSVRYTVNGRDRVASSAA